MAWQMRADGVSEEMIAGFVAEEMEEDEFRRGKGVTEIEALRERRKIPEHIRKLLLANAFCHNCGRQSSRPATRCACATAACPSRVAARNARLRSPGCATDVVVERPPLVMVHSDSSYPSSPPCYSHSSMRVRYGSAP